MDELGSDSRAWPEPVPGSVYVVGPALRVACGDCIQAGVIAAAMGPWTCARACLTSPPYAEQRSASYGGVPPVLYTAWFAGALKRIRPALLGNGSLFLNLAPHSDGGRLSRYVDNLVTTMTSFWDWRLVDELLWLKKDPTPGHFTERFKRAWEPIYHFAASEDPVFFDPEAVAQPIRSRTRARQAESLRSGERSRGRQKTSTGSGFKADRAVLDARETALPSNVIECGTARIKGHPAAWPLELPRRLIAAYSRPGECWLDPFAGSGQLLLAAHETGRRAAGVEKEPAYVETILTRLHKATGYLPALEEGRC